MLNVEMTYQEALELLQLLSSTKSKRLAVFAELLRRAIIEYANKKR